MSRRHLYDLYVVDLYPVSASWTKKPDYLRNGIGSSLKWLREER